MWATSSDAYSEIVREGRKEGRCWGLLKLLELLYKPLKTKQKNQKTQPNKKNPEPQKSQL